MELEFGTGIWNWDLELGWRACAAVGIFNKIHYKGELIVDSLLKCRMDILVRRSCVGLECPTYGAVDVSFQF
ncbi:MAG: hypothetical protein AB8B55_16935 [Mariniblastus sp.]